ncbi:putative outer capsid protein P6 [Raspberry latent virus]|uniref:putative outer capsid protein P6 n=1 Tax=Raspberry latent virus TaxID=907191 RepID=UPI0001E6901D|nr:putative outer capsid protein P6 [Raspberry latent virus]ADO27692.1 putative outer capsid protein P6 [Raspberry latent virus]
MASYTNYMITFLNTVQRIHDQNYSDFPPANVQVRRITFQDVEEYIRDLPEEIKDYTTKTWNEVQGESPMVIQIPFCTTNTRQIRNYAAIVNLAYSCSMAWPTPLPNGRFNLEDVIAEGFSSDEFLPTYRVPPAFVRDDQPPSTSDHSPRAQTPPEGNDFDPDPDFVEPAPVLAIVPHRHLPNTDQPVLPRFGYREEVRDDDADMFDGDDASEVGEVGEEEEYLDPLPEQDRENLALVRSRVVKSLFDRKKVGEVDSVMMRPRFNPGVVPRYGTVKHYEYKEEPDSGWLSEAGDSLVVMNGLVQGDPIPITDIDGIIIWNAREDADVNQRDFTVLEGDVFSMNPRILSGEFYQERVNVERNLRLILLGNCLDKRLVEETDRACSNYLIGTQDDIVNEANTDQDRNERVCVMTSTGLICSSYYSCPAKHRNKIIPIEIGRRVATRLRRIIAMMVEGDQRSVEVLLMYWMRIIYPDTYSPVRNHITVGDFTWARSPVTRDFEIITPYLEGTNDDDGAVQNPERWYPSIFNPHNLFQALNSFPLFLLILDQCSAEPSLEFEVLSERLNELQLAYFKVIFHCTTLNYVLSNNPCSNMNLAIGPYPMVYQKMRDYAYMVCKSSVQAEKAFIYLILGLLGFA